MPPSSPIMITGGLVSGSTSEFFTNVHVYKGIPFAATTAGANRWKAPQPVVPWEGVRKADTPGPKCPQVSPGLLSVNSPQSEDCLYLNIWTSIDEGSGVPGGGCEGAGRPVYVWIFGGRFSFGDAASPTFDGSYLASQGLIVVTINYRLGVFGFLSTPELANESGAAGNYGLLDQIAALVWVKANIAQFGGDTGRVTVGGQSAGAGSVGFLLSSPMTKGLIHGAIVQSGMRVPTDPLISGLAHSYRHKQRAQQQGAEYMDFVGADNIAEMRDLPAEHLLRSSNINDDIAGRPPLFRPCLDEKVIPLSYADALKVGASHEVPVLTGHNRDEEGTVDTSTFDKDDFDRVAKAKFEENGFLSKFNEVYPIVDGTDVADLWNDASRDAGRVSSWLWAAEFRRNRPAGSVFLYHFTQAPPARTGGPFGSGGGEPMRGGMRGGGDNGRGRGLGRGPSAVSFRHGERGSGRLGIAGRPSGPLKHPKLSGAFHGAEIPYTFNSLYTSKERGWTDIDRKVAGVLSAYWVNFIKTGNPNSVELDAPLWPAASGNSHIPTVMRVGERTKVMALADSAARIEFWKEYLRAGPAW